MAIGLSGIAWASTIPLLAVVITLLAVGNGFVNPSITGAISLLADPDDQGGTMGVNQSLSALGRIIGPALGGLFYQQFGRGIPFLVAGGLAGFAMLLTFRVLPQIPTAGRAAKSGGHG